ncbi:MAG: hypothetical protein RsTaC01_1100 [Candidatus Paraimprobicoccus trichonymphae]|uniref:Uncharacterized protein n=1 Tax=Candidatus Paraimprobicoccus trichonymphae TaxID=3033793 RepID=A0AA48KWK6_9FIRM|nr:MAG: hypothetical protein RsTaC01_1100 [Candidatus Paraimprobicoccus trichonymphae]
MGFTPEQLNIFLRTAILGTGVAIFSGIGICVAMQVRGIRKDILGDNETSLKKQFFERIDRIEKNIFDAEDKNSLVNRLFGSEETSLLCQLIGSHEKSLANKLVDLINGIRKDILGENGKNIETFISDFREISHKAVDGVFGKDGTYIIETINTLLEKIEGFKKIGIIAATSLENKKFFTNSSEQEKYVRMTFLKLFELFKYATTGDQLGTPCSLTKSEPTIFINRRKHNAIIAMREFFGFARIVLLLDAKSCCFFRGLITDVQFQEIFQFTSYTIETFLEGDVSESYYKELQILNMISPENFQKCMGNKYKIYNNKLLELNTEAVLETPEKKFGVDKVKRRNTKFELKNTEPTHLSSKSEENKKKETVDEKKPSFFQKKVGNIFSKNLDST